MSQIADQKNDPVALGVRGIEGLGRDEIKRQLAAGARFVVFEYCISLVAVTLRRPTAIYVVRPGEKAWRHGLRYCMVSFFLGWWGVPWGPIYTPLTIVLNLSGGCDVTAQVRGMLTNTEQ